MFPTMKKLDFTGITGHDRARAAAWREHYDKARAAKSP